MWIEIKGQLINLNNVTNVYINGTSVVFLTAGGTVDELYNTSIISIKFESGQRALNVYEKVRKLVRPLLVEEK